MSVESATQPISKIGPHSSDKRAVRGLSITIEGETLTLSKPIMVSPLARSAHQLEFGLHHFQLLLLRIFWLHGNDTTGDGVLRRAS